MFKRNDFVTKSQCLLRPLSSYVQHLMGFVNLRVRYRSDIMKATLCAVKYKEFERSSPWAAPRHIPRILLDYET